MINLNLRAGLSARGMTFAKNFLATSLWILFILYPVRGQGGSADVTDASGFFVDSQGIVVCSDADVGATSTLEVDGVALTFKRVTREDLVSIIDAAAWPELRSVCTSGIKDLSNLFLGQNRFGASDDDMLGGDVDLSHWDVSSVERMDAMFYGAESFNKDLSHWNTSSVVSCSKFADRASSWTEPWPVFSACSPTGKFVLGRNGVTVSCPDAALMESAYIRDKRYTKRDRKLLEDLIAAKSWSEVAASCTTGIEDLSNLFLGQEEFNEDIRSWDVGSVTNMAAMFFDASSFNEDLGVWNVDQVTSCSRFADGTSSWTRSRPKFSQCAPSKFYKHANGVTVLCPDAAVLDTGTIDGVEYTKRDLDGYFGLRYLAVDSTKWDLLDKTCISGVTSLASLFVGAAVLGYVVRSRPSFRLAIHRFADSRHAEKKIGAESPYRAGTRAR